MRRQRRKIFTANKEAKRRSRAVFGVVPTTKVLPNKKRLKQMSIAELRKEITAFIEEVSSRGVQDEQD